MNLSDLSNDELLRLEKQCHSLRNVRTYYDELENSEILTDLVPLITNKVIQLAAVEKKEDAY